MQKIAFVLIAIFAFSACSPSLPATQISATDTESAESEVRSLVENFGERLQMVSLLAPDAATQIEQQYAEFVSPEFLQTWMADPSSAPGRLTSSPWPDHIEISDIQQQNADQYLVTGMVIEITSAEEMNGGIAAQYPVEITVSKASGTWLISGWQAGEYQ
jgi:hypothetical protein